MWLSALALVPLLFSFNASLIAFEEPKTYALHLFALITGVLLIGNAVTSAVDARRREYYVERVDVIAWVRSDRSRWLLSTIVLFTFSYVISTILSPLPFFSLRGVDPASTGYNLYSFLSMMVILAAVVTHLKTSAQIWRIFYVIATVGIVTSVYSIAQSVGWDPIRYGPDQQRVLSSFGNPIYFGAYLVIAIPVTGALALQNWKMRYRSTVALASGALGLEVLALWLTGSRGPLTGFIAGTVIMIAVLWSLSAARPNRRAIAAVMWLSVGPILAITLYTGISGSQDARVIKFSGEFEAVVTELRSSETVLDEVGEDSSGGPVVPGAGALGAGLTGRTKIWGDVLELAFTWERLPQDTGASKLLRSVFGFGPDMLRYSTSLVSGPRTSFEVVNHAHNRLLQVLAELGWMGLTIFLIVLTHTSLLIMTIWYSLRKYASEKSSEWKILLATVVGILGGVAVEQMTGVGRISDILTSWVMIGIVVIIYRMIRQDVTLSAPRKRGVTANQPDIPALVNRRAAHRRKNENVASAVGFGMALLVAIAAISMYLLVDVQNISASISGAKALKNTNPATGFLQFKEARGNAAHLEALTDISAQRLIQEARLYLQNEDPESARILGEQAYRQLSEYHAINPLALDTRVLLANASALLVEIGVTDFQNEMIYRYEHLALQFPNERWFRLFEQSGRSL